MRAQAALLVVLSLLVLAPPARAAEDAPIEGAPEQPATDVPFEDLTLDELVGHAFAGTWLDPRDPYWAPRRGQRWELGVSLGGEGAFGALSTDKLPTIGGVVVTGVLRYYPVDRLAVVVGGRTYLGLDGVPATGTTASSVASAIAGIRYDLVRENRFSLLWDLYSGPSMYVFADLTSASGISSATNSALGGEMGTGLAMRYSVGPLTGEARGLVGGRAGASSSPFQRANAAGPFSAVYAGLDLGLTWSFQ